MIIAQISDTHLTVRGPDSDQRIADFRAVIADINTLDPAPDVIVHTGDIVQNGQTDEYAVAADILAAAERPVFVLAGNKDDRAELRKAFAKPGYLSPDTDFIDYAVEGFPLRLVALDTTNPASKKGDFCRARFDRLKELLQGGDERPVALFLHHPPFEITVGPERYHYDDLNVMGELVRAIGEHGNVVAAFCGHVHRPTTGSIGTIPATVMPSVSTSVRFGEYPAHMKNRPIYFVHELGSGGVVTTAAHIADRWF